MKTPQETLLDSLTRVIELLEQRDIQLTIQETNVLLLRTGKIEQLAKTKEKLIF